MLYRHGPHVTEWFINSPLGLEQGFTLTRRPAGRGELRLALDLAGDLVPRLEAGELAFADRAGQTRLRYGALAAYDADGRALPARMALDGTRLLLAVDDAGARYPVVVDPLFAAETKLTADDGAADDEFGWSVALDGDTALVGAPNANLPDKLRAGAAYLFDSTVDLALIKQVNTDSVPQGDTFEYSLHVTNQDAETDATGVTLTDPLPAGVSYVADDSNCAVSGATVTCDLGTLSKAGGTASVHITVQATAAPGTTLTNTASVTADQSDTNPANNTDSETTLVNPKSGGGALSPLALLLGLAAVAYRRRGR
ncbi:MAG: hypothetical protein WC383_12955 [Gammaproteobacteria bacterium]